MAALGNSMQQTSRLEHLFAFVEDEENQPHNTSNSFPEPLAQAFTWRPWCLRLEAS
jgi:hypothetical protein